MKRLVMVGLGPVHLHALHAFARQRVASAQVVWLSASDKAVMPGQEAACVAGDVARADISWELPPIWRAADVTRCAASVVQWNTADRQLRLSDGQVLSYDALSLDVSALVDREAIPGARPLGLFTRPPDFFLDMVERLIELAQERALNVVLIGSGAAAFEVTLALATRLRRTGSAGSRVAWVTGGGDALEQFPVPLRERALVELKRLGVTVLQAACTSIEPEHVCLDNGARLACDAPVLALPAQLPQGLIDSGVLLTDSGTVDTHATFQSRSHPALFVSHTGAGLSAVGPGDTPTHAAQVGAALAENLRRCIGGGELIPFVAPARPGAALSGPGHQALVYSGTHVWGGRLGGWWKRRADRKAQLSLRG